VVAVAAQLPMVVYQAVLVLVVQAVLLLFVGATNANSERVYCKYS
jgi:hypothetical protein